MGENNICRTRIPDFTIDNYPNLKKLTIGYNDLHELWSLLNFLMPELFDSPEVFDSFYNDEMEEEMVHKLQRV